MVKINSDHTAAVDTSYEWLPINDQTPKGVKVQLLTRSGGIAVYGELTSRNMDGFSAWAPCPRKPQWLKDQDQARRR